MESISFKTRARTVDHLGREQIADCPTAISELWKNSFDAYSTKVSLDIFGLEKPIAVVTDDGHGMNKQEFQDRWLVIGTESKATSEKVAVKDRNGLQERVKQGQKGIGRLSCANLGPILFLISRRVGYPYVASLVDWRMFENPFLNLADIVIPTIEDDELEGIFGKLPEMISALSENISPQLPEDKDSESSLNSLRIKKAWSDFDDLPERAGGMNSKAILASISGINFSIDQLGKWKTDDGEVNHGTALMVSEINYDLRAQLEVAPFEQSISRTRKNFRETLASFIDPYVDLQDEELPSFHKDFSYSVRVWKSGSAELIVGKEKGISRRQVSTMEHCISGCVDEEGIFRGHVKAFGQWLPDQIVINPSTDIRIPTRADTKLGAFDVFIASMEFDYPNTTHDKVEHDLFKEKAKLYSGFMIFRDGLRVLPYGRPDNDFFEIDDKRSRNAGREFWNQRQMFGRIAIQRDHNPNLKDKAGREGFLDNRAAKTLRDLGENLLMQSARKYFGSASSVRKKLLPDIKDAKIKLRDAENRKKLNAKNRRQFSTNLKEGLIILPNLIEELEASSTKLDIHTDADVTTAQETLVNFKKVLPLATIPGTPGSMPPRQKANYSEYRTQAAYARNLFATITKTVDENVEKFKPTDPLSVLETQLEKSRNRISSSLNEWKKSIRSLMSAEFVRVDSLADKRKLLFKDQAEATILLFKVERETFASASSKITNLERSITEENTAIFEPYVRAFESLKESIDLERLATSGLEDLAEARAELDRLNSLAQLGIAVEITGHDLQDFDDIIASGLSQLPKELSDSKAVRDIRLGYEGLTDQLRFLSPLKLSGVKIERWLDGKEIHQYIYDFFAPSLKRNNINFEASDSFLRMRVFDQPSRLLPVFINLVNNSIYWLGTSSIEDRKILLDVADDLVVLADNGPGILAEDIENLFKLFFTKKIHGGRGVGLYLSKANLVSGGHAISYASMEKDKRLKGANFLIKFNGAEFSNG